VLRGRGFSIGAQAAKFAPEFGSKKEAPAHECTGAFLPRSSIEGDLPLDDEAIAGRAIGVAATLPLGKQKGRRPKPTPLECSKLKAPLLLLYALLVGVIPHLTGFLAVVDPGPANAGAVNATAKATDRIATRLFMNCY
jgi:hypothetical protein